MEIVKELWLNKVGESGTNSTETEKNYSYLIDEYCKFVGITLDEIAGEWDSAEDYKAVRLFKRKHERLVEHYKLFLKKRGYAKTTRSGRIAVVQSFYNSLPDLNMDFGIPKAEPEYHNRDIEHEEITRILNQVSPRERAMYSMMSQGGLTPKNLVNLRGKHIKEIFERDTEPYRIDVPRDISKTSHSNHFTFIGEESKEYLNQYFEVRGIPNDNDLVFLPTRKDARGKGKVEKKSISIIFAETVKELGLIPEKELTERKGKPKTLRLYNLRKFFRKYAGLAGVDYVNFWMGHRINSGVPNIPRSDEHYFSKNDADFHRRIYEEKALPNLRIGKAVSSNDIQKLKQELVNARKELAQYRQQYGDLLGFIKEAEDFDDLKSRIVLSKMLPDKPKEKPTKRED